MCDLWRMSLCPDSSGRQTRLWWSNSEFGCRAVRYGRQQRVWVPEDRHLRRWKQKVFLDGGQTYSKGPKMAGPPVTGASSAISHNTFFIDIGAFSNCIKFHSNLHLIITVQTQLKSISKRSLLSQAILPQEVIEGNGVTYWIADFSSPKGVKRNRTHENIHTYLNLFFQRRFHLQTWQSG